MEQKQKMKLLKVYIRRNLKRLNLLPNSPNKINRKFYINNKLCEISFMKQNPFKNNQWSKYAQDGLKVIQIVLIFDDNESCFEYLGVKVENQLYWYDSKNPFSLNQRLKEYSKSSHDNF